MAAATANGDDPPDFSRVQPLDRLHPTQPHPNQNSKLMSRDTQHTASAILDAGDAVAR